MILFRPSIDDRLPIDEIPQIAVKTGSGFAQGKGGARIIDGSRYFQPVADDARIVAQFVGFDVVVTGDFGGVEPVERRAVAVRVCAKW